MLSDDLREVGWFTGEGQEGGNMCIIQLIHDAVRQTLTQDSKGIILSI